MHRRLRIPIAAALVCLGLVFGGTSRALNADASASQDPQALLDSVERFLAERYANFPDRVAKLGLDLPAIHARTDSALRTARTSGQVRRALDEMLANFRDGHLRVQSLRTDNNPGDRRDAIARGASPDAVCGEWGYGRSRSRTAFASLDGYSSLSRTGLPFERGVIRRGSQTFAVLRIDSFGLEPHSAVCAAAWQSWQRLSAADCDNACQQQLRAQIAQRLADSLRVVVAQLSATDARTLIIDLTGNGGGTEWVSRAVRAVSVRSVPPAQVAVISRAAVGQTCDPSHAWRDRTVSPCDFRVQRTIDSTDAALSDTGPWQHRIVLVIDGGTASAAEQFAANLLDHTGAESIGAVSYGAGCGYTTGNRPLVLQELRLEIVAPNCSRFRRDGSNEVDGITPSLDAAWSERDRPAQRAELVLRRLSGI